VSKTLPSNRVAALGQFIAGLAAAGTALAGVWPSASMDKVALISGAAAAGSATLAHIIGSIFWDRTPAGQAKYLPGPTIYPDAEPFSEADIEAEINAQQPDITTKPESGVKPDQPQSEV
jgi:hypothetical protein